MNAKVVRRSLVVWVMLAIPLAVFGASSGPQVKTDSGIVEGKKGGAVHAVLGIPYAAPPVGDLRWKPPIAAAKWAGGRKATEFGAHCMQGNVFGDMNFRDAGGSEDCLFLNVWVPATANSRKLPVMVWIYGGGFVAGSTSEARQDGTHLAQQGVVVVSMNYRLGIFGFFVHPELAKESGRNAAGNYGLLDEVAALHWVHDNIAAFGGDPGNVTIFGQSGGGGKVSTLMGVPAAKGLFHRAIAMSGSNVTGTARDQANKGVEAFLATLNLKPNQIEQLQTMPVAQLLQAMRATRGLNLSPA